MNLNPTRIRNARVLVIDGEIWQYKIGKSYTHIWPPPSRGGKKLIKRTHEIAGRSPDTLERGQYKKTSDGMVTPSDVEKYIRTL